MTLQNLKIETESKIEEINIYQSEISIEKNIVKPERFKDRLRLINKKGYPEGYKTSIFLLDGKIRWYRRQLYIMTGYSFEGKSHLTEQIICYLLATNKNVKAGYYSPEHSIDDFFVRQCTLLVGKEFEYITEIELEECFEFFEKKIFSIDTDDKLLNFDELLDYTEWLVKNRNIEFMIIDNWASILSDDNNASEVKQGISRNLNKLRGFAKKENISFFLIAHPNKPPANRNLAKPIKGYDISGAAEWQAFADVGLTSHRGDFPILDIWKVKQKYQGGIGELEMFYNSNTTRFEFGGFNDNRNLVRVFNKLESEPIQPTYTDSNLSDVPF